MKEGGKSNCWMVCFKYVMLLFVCFPAREMTRGKFLNILERPKKWHCLFFFFLFSCKQQEIWDCKVNLIYVYQYALNLFRSSQQCSKTFDIQFQHWNGANCSISTAVASFKTSKCSKLLGAPVLLDRCLLLLSKVKNDYLLFAKVNCRPALIKCSLFILISILNMIYIFAICEVV